ncbi:hypothetical protein ACFWP7_16490 [Streptomyces sp. NPDC058470]|uniref:hypothetical protein n=1 Tax=Streptomyces sp. NPDC058470 TaxID=3346515 RepID=UPI00365632A1
MQAPLPRRSRGPSAIAAAFVGPGSGSGGHDGSAPWAEPEPAAPPMSAAAAAFAAELAATTTDQALTATPPKYPVTGTAATPTRTRPPAGRRLPRTALLVGAVVAGAALIGGAVLVVRAGGARSSESVRGAVPDTTRGGGAYESTPSGLGSAPPSVAPSASGTSASPQPSVTGSGTDGATRTPAPAQPSTTPAADGNSGPTESGNSDQGAAACTPTAGSGPLTDYSACAGPGIVTLQATFNTAQRYYHAFINTDGNTATGYRLPFPSLSALGADYMIENGVLYKSLSTGWNWTQAAAGPTMTVSGATRTWTLPLTGIGSPTGTQRVEFHAGTDYTPVITFSPK